MATEKIRVYDLAKKLKLPNKDVMDLLADKMNIQVKSHASTISQEEADKLERLVTAGPSSAAKKQEKSPKPAPPKSEVLPPKEPKKEIKKAPEEKPAGQTNEVQKSAPVTEDTKISTGPKIISRPEPVQQRPPQGGQERTGQRPPYQGQRPPYQGQRPPYDRTGQRPPTEGAGGQRPPYQGQRPPYQGQRPPYQGQRPPYDRTGQRPPTEGAGGQRPPYQGTGPRPPYQGQRPPYDRTGQRPPTEGAGGQRPPYQGTGPRPPYQGQRPPFDRTGPRPPYQGTGPRPPYQGQRPPDNRQQIPAKKGPALPREEGGGGGEAPKTPGRREIFNKKKDKFKGKEAFLSKEEKFEQSKLAQDKFKKKKKETKEEEKEVITTVVLDKPLTVGELAAKLQINVVDIIKQLMMSGILATVNQNIDIASAKSVSENLGYTVVEPEAKAEEEKAEELIDETKLKYRAPVVTIMGHVDHGKTTLLDSIRSKKHKIVNTEVGGITQSIGAYTVRINDKKIVFIDTPGHEAFTAMRARGAQATDIAILVVAADDGIMPQTIEAINHAKAAKVPIIVAVNKIDKAGADADRVLQQLTEYDLVPEKWGGDTICIPVSALQGENIDELLEMITLVSEMEDLKADPDKKATGVVIEAELDKGKGAIATLLVQAGTLKIGDYVVVGNVGGRVRALLSDEGERIKKAGPSTPVEISGLTEVPQAGDRFDVVESDKIMKTILSERKEQERTNRLESISPAQVRKEMILQDKDEAKDLNIIIKANTHGSAEAVSAALQQLISKSIFVKIVHVGIGDVSETDVMLASASNAIIIGFSVKEDSNAIRAASVAGVDIRIYDIIYQITEDIEKTMLGLLQPEIKEIAIGTAEIRQVFNIGKTGKIAGCYVTDGKVVRNKTAKIFRNDKEIFKGPIDQLKRFKDDVKEVASGYECGMSFGKFNDIQEGDIIKISTIEEVEREILV